METSGSEQGINHSRSYYLIATNPRIEKTTKRLPSKFQEDSWAWWRISLVGKHKRAKSSGGFVVPSSPGPSSAGFFNRSSSSGVVFSSWGKEAIAPPLPFSLPFCPSQLQQVSCRCAFPRLRGHPIACINYLTI